MMAPFAIYACKESVPQSDGSHQDHYFLIAPRRPILFPKACQCIFGVAQHGRSNESTYLQICTYTIPYRYMVELLLVQIQYQIISRINIVVGLHPSPLVVATIQKPLNLCKF